MGKTVVHITCKKCRALVDAGKEDLGGEVICAVCGTAMKVPTMEELRSKGAAPKLSCPHCGEKFNATPDPGCHTVDCPKCRNPVALQTQGMSDSGALWAGGKPPASAYWTEAWQALLYPFNFINKTAPFIFGIPVAIVVCVVGGRIALTQAAAMNFAGPAAWGVAAAASVAAIALCSYLFSLILMISGQPLKANDVCPAIYGQRHTASTYKFMAWLVLYIAPAFMLARLDANDLGMSTTFSWGFGSYFVLAILGALAPMGLLCLTRQPGSNGLSILTSVKIIKLAPREYFYMVLTVFSTTLFCLLMGTYLGAYVEGKVAPNLPAFLHGAVEIYIRGVFVVPLFLIMARTGFVFCMHFQKKLDIFKDEEDTYPAYTLPRIMNIVGFAFIIGCAYSFCSTYLDNELIRVSQEQTEKLAEAIKSSVNTTRPTTQEEFVTIADGLGIDLGKDKKFSDLYGYRPVGSDYSVNTLWAFELNSRRPDGKVNAIRNKNFEVVQLTAEECKKILDDQAKFAETGKMPGGTVKTVVAH